MQTARERRERARLIPRPAPWMDDAVCAGKPAKMFFPNVDDTHERHSLNVYDAARTICNGCPVKDRCLDYALEHNERHGMWGGRTPKERRRLAGDRRRSGAA